jgi:pyruvate dehydrogenase E1 component
MYYKEDQQGQILEEGINEAGATSAWIACATSYSVSNSPLIPFYIFYSMFGFQRVMDLLWAAGDSQARGFLLGATSGRTTLNGEGLQHQDGHSHLMAHMIPNCVSYDPTYAYELAIIIQHGLKRMYQDDENCFYYITLMNENWHHPEMPVGCEEGVINGMYKLSSASEDAMHTVQLMGSGAILGEVIEAAKILRDDYQIAADIWSMTSFTQLIRDAQECDRWNLLHPEETAKSPYITQQLAVADGPVIAASDYIKTSLSQLAMYIPHHYSVLGTDGFGRSDTRAKLRHFFEVDRYFIVISSLKALADEGDIEASVVSQAIAKFNIDPNKISPMRA